MTRITSKGRELAERVRRYTDLEQLYVPDLLETCSLIARHATSLHHIFEAQCNGHPAMGNPRVPHEQAAKLQEDFEDWCDKREQQLKNRIAELAKSLPGITSVKFQSDPRGLPVRLVTESGQGDSWSEPGAIVV